jgi:hypothetical protein
VVVVGREALAATEEYAVLLESKGWHGMLGRLEAETIAPARAELLRGKYKTREELAYTQGVLEGVRLAVLGPYERFAELLDKKIETVLPETVRRLFE